MELRPRTDWSTKLTVERVQEGRSWLNTERNLLKSLSEDGAESHGDGPVWLTGTALAPGGYGTDAPWALSSPRALFPGLFSQKQLRSTSSAPRLRKSKCRRRVATQEVLLPKAGEARPRFIKFI